MLHVLDLTEAKIAPLTNSFQLTSISAQNSANVTFSLTCNSSGGPVKSVEWMRDGFSLDNTGPLILTNSSTASYTNTLDVSGRLPGTYTCQIRGPDNQILSSMDVPINGIYRCLSLNITYFKPPKIHNVKIKLFKFELSVGNTAFTPMKATNPVY